MKDLNELNEKMDQADDIIDILVKKTIELEKRASGMRDYSVELETIIDLVNEIKAANRKGEDLHLLQAINAKLDKQPKPMRQIRLLLFPETNQGTYYKLFSAG